MVAQGWALAYRYYSRDYVSQERSASKAKLGMWQGEFEPPWDWRHKNPQAPAQRSGQPARLVEPPAVMGGKDFAGANKDCAIKGNISPRGRIYHMPGDESYAKTGINLAKGERWFCTEAEAQAAGWRRARR
jgi:hypothetical protein